VAGGLVVAGRPRRTRARALYGARGGATRGILVRAAVADTHSPRVAQRGNRRPRRATVVANEEPAHATVVPAPEEREGLRAEHAHLARVGCPVRGGARLPLAVWCRGLHDASVWV
jgi:anti-sigma factor RsiW